LGLRNLVLSAGDVWEVTRHRKTLFEPHFEMVQFKKIEWKSFSFNGF
jgi:hypothetical protein